MARSFWDEVIAVRVIVGNCTIIATGFAAGTSTPMGKDQSVAVGGIDAKKATSGSFDRKKRVAEEERTPHFKTIDGEMLRTTLEIRLNSQAFFH